MIERFGRTSDGQDVRAYTLEPAGGMHIEVIDYGAIVRCINVPDRHNRLIDVALGYDDIESYEGDRSYIGAAIGRYVNRIRNGIFSLDGTTYHLSTNDGAHHLHGGSRGFGKVVWRATSIENDDKVGVVLEHTSPDGDQGYPGNLDVQITYSLSTSNIFSIDYRATTDRPTPVNLTQHSYFNLSGEGTGDVLDHELTIHADSFTEIDSGLIPTGKLASVEGTPLDFREPRQIGTRIEQDYEQLTLARGYDHNFVLSHPDRQAARVFSLATGITMEVFTTEPGMQFYSGNFLETPRSGFCLETQHFPDSPNHPQFPSTILRPDEEFRSHTEYRFSTQ